MYTKTHSLILCDSNTQTLKHTDTHTHLLYLPEISSLLRTSNWAAQSHSSGQRRAAQCHVNWSVWSRQPRCLKTPCPLTPLISHQSNPHALHDLHNEPPAADNDPGPASRLGGEPLMHAHSRAHWGPFSACEKWEPLCRISP